MPTAPAILQPSPDWRAIVGDRIPLVLAVRPGDETARFGTLLARACAAGRPPFVAVLTDGSSQPGAAGEPPHRVALRRERETRAAAAAMDLVMWRNDCHVLVAAEGGDPDTAATIRLAHAVARRTGLPLVLHSQ